jgi:hypothetical protein
MDLLASDGTTFADQGLAVFSGGRNDEDRFRAPHVPKPEELQGQRVGAAV